MCGIVGYVATKGHNFDIRSALKSIGHRGPDHINFEEHDLGSIKVILGHVRLSIIDLNVASNQPFQSSCGQISLIFNGEIYNYRLLKLELERSGYVFRTNSDTEVILALYQTKGMEFLDWIEGMFALIIYDAKDKKLIMVRDPLGIKPLYVLRNEWGVFFASEIKAFLALGLPKPQIDLDAMTEFLLNGFLYEPDSGFIGIKKILPGCFCEIDLTDFNQLKSLKYVQYWKLKKNKIITEFDVVIQIENSIKDHLVSDVPIGLYFSGGVDSSVIISNLKEETESFIVKSRNEEYSIAGFVNDYYYANKISRYFRTKLNCIELNDYFSENFDFLKSIELVATISEEPIADYTSLSSYLISKKVKERNFKVMLSGMGADELFCGYPRYKLIKYETLYRIGFVLSKPLLGLMPRYKKKIERLTSFFEETELCWKYTSLLSYFSKSEIEKLLGGNAKLVEFEAKFNNIIANMNFDSNLKKVMYVDLFGFLVHNFIVTDKSSMLSGVEVRVPLATRKLAEATFNLPDKHLLNFRKQKIILKNYLEKYLPKRLIYRRKTGFNPPLDNLIRELGHDNIYDFMKKNDLFEVLNEFTVRSIISQHFMGNTNNSFKIYNLLYLSAWYKNNK